MYPDDRKYSKDHEWVRVADGTGTIGITDYAQSQLGDVVFLELPQIGAELRAGEQFGTVESVKAVSELYAPVSGKVVEVNSALADKPEDVNGDPHEAAWMLRMELSNAAELDALLDAAGYAALVESEGK